MDAITYPENGSLIRFFHTVENAPAIDIYINNELLFQNLCYRQFSGYTQIASGKYIIQIFAANTKKPALLCASVTLPKDELYTLVISGSIDDLQLLILADSNHVPLKKDTCNIRVVALAPKAGHLNVSLDKSIFVKELDFCEMTPYAQVPANTYIFRTNSSITITELASFRLATKEGQTNTIYIMGDHSEITALQSIDGSSYVSNS